MRAAGCQSTKVQGNFQTREFVDDCGLARGRRGCDAKPFGGCRPETASRHSSVGSRSAESRRRARGLGTTRTRCPSRAGSQRRAVQSPMAGLKSCATTTQRSVPLCLCGGFSVSLW